MLAGLPRVLLFGKPEPSSSLTKLESIAEVHYIPRTPLEEAKKNVRGAVEAHGPFTAFGFSVTMKEFFPWDHNEYSLGPLAPHCQLYARVGAGYDMVDVEWITSTSLDPLLPNPGEGVAYCCSPYSDAWFSNAPTAVSKATAEGALTLLLAAAKGLTPQEHALRQGRWRDLSVRTLDLASATVGIVGMGTLGAHLALRLAPFGPKIIYHTRKPKPDLPYEHVSRAELFSRADAIVLACPLTDETRGFVNKESLAQMRDGVFIVNVARGPVVVEQDLVDALESGKVQRAALDVFEKEPEVHQALMANYRVTLSPHSIGGFDSVGPRTNVEMVENIIAFLETGRPLTPINAATLRR